MGLVSNFPWDDVLIIVYNGYDADGENKGHSYAQPEFVQFLKNECVQYEETETIETTEFGDAKVFWFHEKEMGSHAVLVQSIGGGGQGSPNVIPALQLFNWSKFLDWLESLSKIARLIVVILLSVLSWKIVKWLKR